MNLPNVRSDVGKSSDHIGGRNSCVGQGSGCGYLHLLEVPHAGESFLGEVQHARQASIEVRSISEVRSNFFLQLGKSQSSHTTPCCINLIRA